MENNSKQAKSDSPEVKKPYQTPELLNYGSLPEITKAAGNTMLIPDGATMGNLKTS